jgi:hypothetical protein
MQTSKVVFLDIDGVLQPFTQYRHDHIKAGDLEQLYIDLKEKHGIDYSQFDKYDVAATYWDWNQESVSLLKEILDETNSKIVVSSDWRHMAYFFELLKIHDLDKYYRGRTVHVPCFSRYHEMSKLLKEVEKDLDMVRADGYHYNGVSYNDRCLEIAHYVKNNPDIINYVAIDDDTSLSKLGGHYIKTFPRIKVADRDRAIEAMNNEALYFDKIWEKWKQQTAEDENQDESNHPDLSGLALFSDR